MPEPHLRAADADRAAVATALGQHMSAGRLTMEEYDERLARAYSARTYGELSELTADLPGPTPASRPAPTMRPVHAGYGRCGAAGYGLAPHAWRSWLRTAVIVLAIWAATSLATWQFIYPWPIWVIVPWGAVLLSRTLAGGRDDVPAQRRRPG